MSINSTHISGNLAHDCKVFKNEDGKSTVYFTVNCCYRAKNRETGKWKCRPDFVECRAYGRSNAFAAMLTHGRPRERGRQVRGQARRQGPGLRDH